VYPFMNGSAGSVLIENTGTNGYVIADAARFAPYDTCTTTSVFASGHHDEPVSLRVSPNPGTGMFRLHADPDTYGHIEVYNTMGRLVRVTGPCQVNGCTIDLTQLPRGVYVLVCWTGRSVGIVKLLKLQ
jgi:hypothetical protein